jgi:hypothetical protein
MFKIKIKYAFRLKVKTIKTVKFLIKLEYQWTEKIIEYNQNLKYNHNI